LPQRKNDPLTGGGGRSHHGKILVVGAVEVEDSGAGPGRIRLSQVPDYSASSLHAFLAANLTPGTTAKTDGWSGYPGAAGLTHEPHVVGIAGRTYQEHNTTILGDRHDRASPLFDRVPTAVRRRGGLRAVSHRDALA
jgi:hypothetical protein